MSRQERGGLIELAPLAARGELELNSERPAVSAHERAQLVHQARVLAWVGNTWHSIEFAIAVGAGIVAGSVALIGFGADAVIEAFGGFIILWRFAERRSHSETAERRAQQLVAGSYAFLVAYILVESTRTLVGGHHPQPSWVGIGLAAFTASAMPLLALAKRRVGRQLASPATLSEAAQNQICAYLSVALLIGLLANALAGWWWADPAAALVIAAVAAKEGIDAWHGESCACLPVQPRTS